MRVFSICVTAVACLAHQSAAVAASLCGPLRKFVESVQPNDSRTVEFRTSWGEGFKDSEEPALAAKRCQHGGYEPAKAVCAYLMEYGATEFSGNNAKEALACLSRNTRFAPQMSLSAIALSFSYGTENRGSLIELTFAPDEHIGGMVLAIKADGY